MSKPMRPKKYSLIWYWNRRKYQRGTKGFMSYNTERLIIMLLWHLSIYSQE